MKEVKSLDAYKCQGELLCKNKSGLLPMWIQWNLALPFFARSPTMETGEESKIGSCGEKINTTGQTNKLFQNY